ncbi:MAG: 50S ribosomal protein L6 [Patescibacteria group bacterium]|nr:50S ribosomal protein L6 [Patescibacteria group bacterium]
MSRIGKQPIEIPTGVEIKLEANQIIVKGPKGILTQQLNPAVIITQDGSTLMVTVKDPEEKSNKSMWGLFQRLISNMVTGVTTGFTKQLEINGVGYRAAVAGKILNLQLGYSHPIDYQIPDGIEISVEKNIVSVSGSDKQVVGQTAAEIRSLRKPEPYKGKGIKYTDETIKRKVGKQAAKGAA